MAEFPATADVVVIGGGVHGASVAYHLARKRAGRVVLVEKKFLASGPTGRSTALVRGMYPTDFHTRTGSAAVHTFEHWQEIIGGDPGFRQVGFMVLAHGEAAANLKANVLRAQKVGSVVHLLSPDDVKKMVPQINVEDITLASYEPRAGFADPAMTTNALGNRARQLGATIVQYTAVTEILTAGGNIAGVRTDKGEISAPAVVNCGGLWANRLLAPLGIDVAIQIKRTHMCFFRRPPELGVHPALMETPHFTYMRPDLGDLTIHGILGTDETADIDRYNEGVEPEEIVRNAELIAHRIPAMENGLSRGGYAGLLDFTLDHDAVLGPMPEYPGLYADFGWSGHGFKHAVVTGDIISDVVLHGRSKEYDVTPFRWTRFQEGDLLPGHGPTTAPTRSIP